MATDLNPLVEQVKGNSDLKQSAKALVDGLASRLDGLTQDPLAIKDLADSLRANSDALASAVVANTQALGPQVPAGAAPAVTGPSAATTAPRGPK